MNEQKSTISNKTPHRKGFALIITLSALAVIIALTGVLISYLDEARKDSITTKAMIQGNLYYADIKKIFTKFKKRKTLYSTLYLSAVPFVSPDGRFSVIVNCTPLANGININWLGMGNRDGMSEHVSMAQNIFEFIVQEYNLEDGTRLEEMILEDTGAKNRFLQREQSRLLQKNGIISFKQFKQVLERYQYEADDPKISEVDWKKFFFFSKNIDLVDGNYLSAEVISLLFDIDIETVKDGWVEGETKLKDFVQKNGGVYTPKLYTEEFLEEVKCDIQYTYRDERYAFTFIDSQGEVKDFEFNGKQ